MGLMDKFKDLFTDEEVVEEDDAVEIKEVKKEEEDKLPTFMREKIEKEEQKSVMDRHLDVGNDIDVKKEIKLEDSIDINSTNDLESDVDKQRFKFPIDFTDSDFVPETRSSRQSLRAKEREDDLSRDIGSSFEEKSNDRVKSHKELKVASIYKDKREDKKEEIKSFRATPIISPIYGVLDKNYDANDVINKKGSNLEHSRPSKNIDFDSVRKKAYGNISKEIKDNLVCENCEYLKEARDCKNMVKQDTCDYSYEDVNDITVDEAAENYFDYGVPYEKSTSLESVDDTNYYLDEDDVVITDYHEEEDNSKNNDIPPVRSSINLLSTLKKSMGDEDDNDDSNSKKDLQLTDDLYNLIDSMYDERNEGK